MSVAMSVSSTGVSAGYSGEVLVAHAILLRPRAEEYSVARERAAARRYVKTRYQRYTSRYSIPNMAERNVYCRAR